MKIFLYTAATLLLLALYVYFLGTPLVANLTGFSLRSVSLFAGTAIAVLGFSVMTFGKLAAKRAAEHESEK
jgi:hypothetical protein